MKILVTGGAGFIGSGFARIAMDAGNEIRVMDKLTYAGSISSVPKDTEFVNGDITNRKNVEDAVKGMDCVVNFAAETHVDNSIKDASPFINSNIIGTHVLLEAMRKKGSGRFLHISTDEVYGSREIGAFQESDTLNPRNPYSATKAAAEHLVTAYNATYGVDTLITRSSNNYGPRQNPEKFIPKAITNAIRGKSIPVYGKGEQKREWIYVDDNCAAILAVLKKGPPGATYNVGTGEEIRNIDLARMVLGIMKKSESLVEFVADRPGHDFRYAMDLSKIRKLGWKPKRGIKDGLKITAEWYKENKQFWSRNS